jgi:hypothetical protein
VKAPTLFAFIFTVSTVSPPCLMAQTASDAPGSNPERAERTAYVRRFSVAVRVSVLPLSPISNSTYEETLPAGPTAVSIRSESLGSRLGGGLGLQLALSDLYSLTADMLYRKFHYTTTTELRTGVDSSSTTEDDRTLRTIVDETETGAWEVPILLRRYSKSRFQAGPSWFIEAGGAVRHARKPRTWREEDDETTAVPPNVAAGWLPGASAGLGVHLTDDFGIRVIPQVRYTYWFSRTVDSRPARSAAHQVEVLVGISF